MIVQDPEILSGIPVIRGTRVAAHDVAASIAAGKTTLDIRNSYPTLDDKQIKGAVAYVAANPLRGRPKGTTLVDKGVRVISKKKISIKAATSANETARR